jgi:biotin carboxylase
VRGAVAAAQSLGFPVVVKPVSGSGSVGVRLCANTDEVACHAEILLGRKRNERGLPVLRRVLIELLAEGPEYSVETCCQRVIGITQKYLGSHPYFVEMGHDYPAEIPASDRESLLRLVRRALIALRLGWWPAHTELRLTKDGPRIIEVNARLAGGYIPELIRLASGIDLIKETIRLVTGRQPELEPSLDRYASIRFITPQKEGVLIGAEGLSEAGALPGVIEARLYHPLGSRVSCHRDFRDRIGHVIASSSLLAEARQTAQASLESIRVMVEPDSINH